MILMIYTLSRNIKFLVTVKEEIVEGKSRIAKKKYVVPEKFKDNKEAIEEIKKIFEIYDINIKYYQNNVDLF